MLLHRTKAFGRYQTFVFEDWLGGFYASPNMQGTRAALPMACAWAILHRLGTDGYQRLTRLTIDTRLRLVDGVRAIPELTVLGEPEAHPVAISADEHREAPIDVFALGGALAQRAGSTTARSRPTPSTPPSAPATLR